MTSTIYTNEYSAQAEQEAREYLFEEYGESNGWNSPEEVPCEEMWNELSFQNEINWNDFEAEAKKFFDDYFLVKGSIGRWNGRFYGYKMVTNFNELCTLWNDCDYITIKDINGKFQIEATHHDGTNYYEVKRMTHKGLERLQHYEERCGVFEYDEQYIYNILFNDSHYTHLPCYEKSFVNA